MCNYWAPCKKSGAPNTIQFVRKSVTCGYKSVTCGKGNPRSPYFMRVYSVSFFPIISLIEYLIGCANISRCFMFAAMQFQAHHFSFNSTQDQNTPGRRLAVHILPDGRPSHSTGRAKCTTSASGWTGSVARGHKQRGRPCRQNSTSGNKGLSEVKGNRFY